MVNIYNPALHNMPSVFVIISLLIPNIHYQDLTILGCDVCRLFTNQLTTSRMVNRSRSRHAHLRWYAILPRRCIIACSICIIFSYYIYFYICQDLKFKSRFLLKLRMSISFHSGPFKAFQFLDVGRCWDLGLLHFRIPMIPTGILTCREIL
jgi:hypothetical protein